MLRCVRFSVRFPCLRDIFFANRENQSRSIRIWHCLTERMKCEYQQDSTAGTYLYRYWYLFVPPLVLICTTAGTNPQDSFLSVPHKPNPSMSPCSYASADQSSTQTHGILRKILRNITPWYTIYILRDFVAFFQNLFRARVSSYNQWFSFRTTLPFDKESIYLSLSRFCWIKLSVWVIFFATCGNEPLKKT